MNCQLINDGKNFIFDMKFNLERKLLMIKISGKKYRFSVDYNLKFVFSLQKLLFCLSYFCCS